MCHPGVRAFDLRPIFLQRGLAIQRTSVHGGARPEQYCQFQSL
jgi:hypothetical protein